MAKRPRTSTPPPTVPTFKRNHKQRKKKHKDPDTPCAKRAAIEKALAQHDEQPSLLAATTPTSTTTSPSSSSSSSSSSPPPFSTTSSASPSPPPNASAAKIRACDPCRKRKIKCDGAAPCGQCKKARFVCQFSQAKKPGRPRRNDIPMLPPSPTPVPGASTGSERACYIPTATYTPPPSFVTVRASGSGTSRRRGTVDSLLATCTSTSTSSTSTSTSSTSTLSSISPSLLRKLAASSSLSLMHIAGDTDEEEEDDDEGFSLDAVSRELDEDDDDDDDDGPGGDRYYANLVAPVPSPGSPAAALSPAAAGGGGGSMPDSPAVPLFKATPDEYEELVPAEMRAAFVKLAKTRHKFEYDALSRFFIPRAFGELDSSSPPWLRMAFYAYIAIVAHSARELTYQGVLERRVREIAGQLFDQVHPGTAAAFAFAARYYWAQNQDLSDYYTRIVVGICQQLLQQYQRDTAISASPSQDADAAAATTGLDDWSSDVSPSTTGGSVSGDSISVDSASSVGAGAGGSDYGGAAGAAPPSLESPEFVLQIQLFAAMMCGVRPSQWQIQLIESTINQLEQCTENDMVLLAAPVKFSLMRLMLLVRVKVSSAINRLAARGDILMSDLQFTEDESATLLTILDMFENASYDNKSFNRWVRPVITISLLSVRIIIYLGTRQYDTCLALVRVVLTLCEERKCRFEHWHPILPELIYWIVRVCHTLNQPLLTRRALAILRKLVSVYSDHKSLYLDAAKLVPVPQLTHRDLQSRDFVKSLLKSFPLESASSSSSSPALSLCGTESPSNNANDEQQQQQQQQQYQAATVGSPPSPINGAPPSPISWEQVLQRPFLMGSSWPSPTASPLTSEDNPLSMLLESLPPAMSSQLASFL